MSIDPKLGKVKTKLDQAEETAEMVKPFLPPGIKGRVQDAEDVIEIGKAGISLWQRIAAKFKKKK